MSSLVWNQNWDDNYGSAKNMWHNRPPLAGSEINVDFSQVWSSKSENTDDAEANSLIKSIWSSTTSNDSLTDNTSVVNAENQSTPTNSPSIKRNEIILSNERWGIVQINQTTPWEAGDMDEECIKPTSDPMVWRAKVDGTELWEDYYARQHGTRRPQAENNFSAEVWSSNTEISVQSSMWSNKSMDVGLSNGDMFATPPVNIPPTGGPINNYTGSNAMRPNMTRHQAQKYLIEMGYSLSDAIGALVRNQMDLSKAIIDLQNRYRPGGSTIGSGSVAHGHINGKLTGSIASPPTTVTGISNNPSNFNQQNFPFAAYNRINGGPTGGGGDSAQMNAAAAAVAAASSMNHRMTPSMMSCQTPNTFSNSGNTNNYQHVSNMSSGMDLYADTNDQIEQQQSRFQGSSMTQSPVVNMQSNRSGIYALQQDMVSSNGPRNNVFGGQQQGGIMPLSNNNMQLTSNGVGSGVGNVRPITAAVSNNNNNTLFSNYHHHHQSYQHQHQNSPDFLSHNMSRISLMNNSAGGTNSNGGFRTPMATNGNGNNGSKCLGPQAPPPPSGMLNNFAVNSFGGNGQGAMTHQQQQPNMFGRTISQQQHQMQQPQMSQYKQAPPLFSRNNSLLNWPTQQHSSNSNNISSLSSNINGAIPDNSQSRLAKNFSYPGGLAAEKMCGIMIRKVQQNQIEMIKSICMETGSVVTYHTVPQTQSLLLQLNNFQDACYCINIIHNRFPLLRADIINSQDEYINYMSGGI